ncbi:hypothetical protein F5X99DRAFT_428430 [Biscogniauxia marginata]|nr:hypothetical protein F5X99DRAFT_428430 [Biscogniauxia marginata]
MMVAAGWAAPAISSALYPRLYLYLLIFFLLATTAGAIPIDYFPLNSQLPPVARVSEPFSFAFSPQTFSSPLEMTYRLGDGAPEWLSLDSGSRTLSGTPGEGDVPPGGGDVVGVIISLIARDATGEAATNATLVVSRNPTPRVAIPLSEQIPRLGAYSPPASLLLHPSREFKFSFSKDTFRVDDKDEDDRGEEEGGSPKSRPRRRKRKDQALNYYAVSGNNAPLPSWIEFDSSSLTFSGQTPPFESLVQPPQTFTFQLVASDVVGFASAAIPFSIVVGNHELTADEPVVKLNATRGRRFEYADLPKVLKIDKRPLQHTDLSSINATGLPHWLSFDEEKTWKVSGTPDAKAEPVNITIVVVDKFLDTLNLTLEIDVDMPLFKSGLPDLNITAGDDFSFDLKKFLLKPSDTRIAIKGRPDEPWIHLNATALTLSGRVPQPQSAGFANEVHLALNATSKSKKHTETKEMSIHILSPSTSKPAQPTATSNPDDDTSRRNLLWLLIIPILLVCIATIAFLFYLRRRRQGPNKLDLKEVSAPIPGSFVFNGPSSLTESSIQDMRRIVDIGPAAARDSAAAQQGVGTNAPATPSNLTSSGTSNLSVNGDLPPHALTMHSAIKSPKKPNVIRETRDSWLAGQTGRSSIPLEKRTGADETSLLSDTSLGEGESHITDSQSSDISRTTANEAFRGTLGLDIPLVAEPFSIQPTPELAYTASRKYDMSSDDEAPPPLGYIRRPRPGQQQNSSLGLRSVGHRLSKTLKRMSGSKNIDVKRHSNLSSSTGQTTRTSILTSGVAEEATMSTTTNMIARPTVIHIPSRPGEARQVSRRTSEATPPFAGRPLTNSQRNFRLASDGSPADAVEENPKQPPILPGHAATSHESDTPWDRIARNSLGIAYEDLLGAGPEARRSFLEQKEAMSGESQRENWKIHHTSQELMSPDQWPVPNAFMGIAITSDAVRSQSEPPQLPPLTSVATSEALMTPKGKGKGIISTHRASRGSGSYSLKSQTPSTRSRHKRRSSRDERLRISRIREQRVHDEFRAMMSQTPSPNNEWYPPEMRTLPETPTRASRALLTDRLNEMHAGSGDRGLRSAPSKRSQRTARSAKSVRSVWAGEDEDDDDAWEDVRPPESMIGGWEEGDSQGSFSVYI